MKTRSAAATNSAGLIFFPLLFLTPNFVPRDMLTRGHGDRGDAQPRDLRDGGAALARARRPGLDRHPAQGYAVVAVCFALMLALNIRVIKNYD